jgi:rhamnulose-1-phosphate aldolase
MNVYETEVIRGFVRLCMDGFAQGWHERNGGNLTYRMTAFEDGQFEALFVKRPWREIGAKAENLAGERFLVTGTGKYFRNVELAPAANTGIVEINESGDKYRVVWGFEPNEGPTSEFLSHFLSHSVKKAEAGGNRVIYHAHPPNLIALTNVLPLTARDFSRALWKSMPECPIVFPKGVGVAPFMVPGSSALAEASAELMRTYDAIVWAHHGLFASGKDFDETFGLVHTIEKSAEIYIKALSSGQGINQTISDDELREVASAFGVALNERLLL